MAIIILKSRDSWNDYLKRRNERNSASCFVVLQTSAHELRMLKARTDSWVEETRGLLTPVSPETALGSGDQYMRHLAYADPQGRFSIMVLVWRPGQFSPVHAHQTSCAYRVLQGKLSEQHFRWDSKSNNARLSGSMLRETGGSAVALQGLNQIHRLGNAANEVAISLHMYGVARTEIETGINLVLDSVLH